MDTIERSSRIIGLMLSGRGATYGEIMARTGITRRTAQRWIALVRLHFADQFSEENREGNEPKRFRITPTRNGWASRWSRQRPTPAELTALDLTIEEEVKSARRDALVSLRGKLREALR